MDNIDRRKHIFSLIVLSVLTVTVWNSETFLRVLSAILPGDILNQSILSNDHPVSLTIIYCAVFFGIYSLRKRMFRRLYFLQRKGGLPPPPDSCQNAMS